MRATASRSVMSSSSMPTPVTCTCAGAVAARSVPSMPRQPSSRTRTSATFTFASREVERLRRAVRLRLHAAPPCLVLDVPAHRLADALLEGVLRLPAEPLLDERVVHRVPPVVAEAVGDV